MRWCIRRPFEGVVRFGKDKEGQLTIDEIYDWIKYNENYDCLKATGRQRKVEFSEKYSVYIYIF